MSDLLTESQSLPLILLGPILRRVDEKQICIWLAASKPVTIKAKIFRFEDLAASNLSNNPAEPIKPVGLGITKSLRLGQHLYVAPVIARPIANEASDRNFPTNELLAYDIEVIDDDSDKTMNLNDLGLLSGKNSIVYESVIPLPTLFLRGKTIR